MFLYLSAHESHSESLGTWGLTRFLRNILNRERYQRIPERFGGQQVFINENYNVPSFDGYSEQNHPATVCKLVLYFTQMYIFNISRSQGGELVSIIRILRIGGIQVSVPKCLCQGYNWKSTIFGEKKVDYVCTYVLVCI